MAISDEAFQRLVDAAYRELPAAFRALTADVLIHTQETAEPAVLAEMGIDHPLDLLGLYQGVDVTRKSILDTGDMPDQVFLYRAPIIAYADAMGERLRSVITHVLVHEIGHHFGLSDEAMHAIEDAADTGGGEGA